VLGKLDPAHSGQFCPTRTGRFSEGGHYARALNLVRHGLCGRICTRSGIRSGEREAGVAQDRTLVYEHLGWQRLRS
jgi:hypothetical protein